jgi:hypothetical protein
VLRWGCGILKAEEWAKVDADVSRMVREGLLRIGSNSLGTRFYVSLKNVSTFEEAERNVDTLRRIAEYVQSKLECEVYVVTWDDFLKALKGEKVETLAYFPRRGVKG